MKGKRVEILLSNLERDGRFIVISYSTNSYGPSHGQYIHVAEAEKLQIVTHVCNEL
jgi:hypothetical protein